MLCLIRSIRVGLVLTAVLTFTAVSAFRACIATKNEIGYLGADKAGRQILLQSLEAVVAPGVKIESDFFDTPFILRLIQEPMRTTLRFHYTNGGVALTESDYRAFLDQPAENLIEMAEDGLYLRDDWSVSQDSLRNLVSKWSIRTMEDLLGGYGFRRFQVYQSGRKLYSFPIRQKKLNELVVGS